MREQATDLVKMSTEMLTAIGIFATLLTVLIKGFYQDRRERRRDELMVKNRELDIADRKANSDKLATKIDENTDISVKAFDVANNVNAKIATVAVQANDHAITSMNDVMKELASLKATAEETRRLLHLRV
jgi:uncharacterized membrane protein YhiD involved in acid resistance